MLDRWTHDFVYAVLNSSLPLERLNGSSVLLCAEGTSDFVLIAAITTLHAIRLERGYSIELKADRLLEKPLMVRKLFDADFALQDKCDSLQDSLDSNACDPSTASLGGLSGCLQECFRSDLDLFTLSPCICADFALRLENARGVYAPYMPTPEGFWDAEEGAGFTYLGDFLFERFAQMLSSKHRLKRSELARGHGGLSLSDGRKLMNAFNLRRTELFFFEPELPFRLKDLQALLTSALVRIDEFMHKHNIKYFLGGGTLLGAVRHGGFIPWDDDIDLMMQRKDFDRFIELARAELQPPLSLQIWQSGDGYHDAFAKVRIDNTIYSTEFSIAQESMHQGVFIDIFAHDATSNLPIFQKLHVFRTRLARSMVFHKWENTPMHCGSSVLARIISRLATCYINKASMLTLEKRRERILRRYNTKRNAKYLYDGMGEHLRHGAFDAGWLADVTYMQFEGHSLPVPKAFDEYLTYSYGDYMRMPPFALRRIGHKLAKSDIACYPSFNIKDYFSKRET